MLPPACSLLSEAPGPAFPLGCLAGCLCNHHLPGATDLHSCPGQPHHLDRHECEARGHPVQLCQNRSCQKHRLQNGSGARRDHALGELPMGKTVLRWALPLHSAPTAKQRHQILLPLKASKSHPLQYMHMTIMFLCSGTFNLTVFLKPGKYLEFAIRAAICTIHLWNSLSVQPWLHHWLSEVFHFLR